MTLQLMREAPRSLLFHLVFCANGRSCGDLTFFGIAVSKKAISYLEY